MPPQYVTAPRHVPPPQSGGQPYLASRPSNTGATASSISYGAAAAAPFSAHSPPGKFTAQKSHYPPGNHHASHF